MKKITLMLAGLMTFATLSFAGQDGEGLYKRCAGCHGIDGQKKALGTSEKIGGWETEKFTKAMNGYKDGTYGKAMKGVMKGQVVTLKDKDIEALAKYVNSLK